MTIDVELAVASFTSDADLGLDPDRLADVPLLEAAIRYLTTRVAPHTLGPGQIGCVTIRVRPTTD